MNPWLLIIHNRELLLLVAIMLGGIHRGVGSNFGLVRQVAVYGSTTIVCKAHCMRSMPKLGGSGGMPPQENFEN